MYIITGAAKRAMVMYCHNHINIVGNGLELIFDSVADTNLEAECRNIKAKTCGALYKEGLMNLTN